MIGLIGRKMKMDQIFMANGNVVPVTVIEAGPCPITQVKTKKSDGYDAIQLGFGKRKKPNKPTKGHFRNAKVEATFKLVEMRVKDPSPYKIGSMVSIDIFKEGDLVQVTGHTKGRGFAGGVKRWGWAGGPASHGSCFHRRPGSIGSHTWPGRVWKNRKMPGRYGNERVTIKNLKVIKIEKEKNLLWLRGAVPGPRNGYLVILKGKNGN